MPLSDINLAQSVAGAFMAKSAFSYSAATRAERRIPSLDPRTDDKRSLGLFNGIFYAFFQVGRPSPRLSSPHPGVYWPQATQITGSLLAGVLRQFLSSDMPLFLVYVGTAVAGTVLSAFIRSDADAIPPEKQARGTHWGAW